MTIVQDMAALLAAALALLLMANQAMAEQELTPNSAFCASCHGEAGVSRNPLVPTLAGQPYTLIEDNLLAFRAGKRACSPQPGDGSPAALLALTMCARVADLTDEEITALAGFFERQAFEPAEQSFYPQLADRGARLHIDKGCEGCHSDGGRTTNDMAPVLAGQWTPYLRRAMDALRAGERQGPKVMNAAIHALEAREVEALLNYYAFQRE